MEENLGVCLEITPFGISPDDEINNRGARLNLGNPKVSFAAQVA